MKASKYCTTYRVQEQRGTFQGIDTCNVTNFRDFSYCSRLLDESDSRSIKNRPDINVLLGNLEKEGVISARQVSDMRKRAMEACPSDEVRNKCLSGATYVTLEDSLVIQQEIGLDKSIKVTCDQDNLITPVVLNTKRNWIQSIVHYHAMDNYGAHFSVIPQFTSTNTDTRILWTLCGMLVCVKELWTRTDQCEMVVSKWHGWVLAYLTRKCFPGVTIKSDVKNPICSKFVSSIQKLMEKLYIEVGSSFDYESLGDMFCPWIY